MAQNTKYKRLLFEKGISQREVAEKTGLMKSLVNLTVNGYGNITLSTLKKLCVFHKCSPNDIVEWEKWIADAKKKEAKAK